jgi:integrase/recombinase XerD
MYDTSGLRRGYPGMKPPNAGRRFPPEPLTRAEALALLGGFGRGPCGQRNRALCVLLWRSGLRISEALALYPRDVDTDAGTVRVRRGKGGKYRLIGVDAQALAVVQLWMAARAKLGLTGRQPLFCKVDARYRGGAMNAAYYRDALKRAAARAGIEKRVHPHGLRHTHAFELSLEGVPLNVIKAQLGHSSLATTERYINHLAPAQVVAAMQAREWADQPEGVAS